MAQAAWSDIQLLSKIKKGGEQRKQAIGSLYMDYAGKFEWFFMKHRIPQEIAQDLVQDTFVNITKGCDSFRNECEFSGWLWTVARNTMLGHFRKNTKHVDNLDEYEEVDDSKDLKAKEYGTLEDCVRQSIAEFGKLEPERANVLTLSALEGWSSNEVAVFLKRSAGATREYISQCRKKLAKFMEDCEQYIQEAKD